LAWLAPEFEEACSKEKFMQADASKERRCSISPPVYVGDSRDMLFAPVQPVD